MAVYFVFQGETFEHERAGGYVWSPQLTKKGGHNAGYTMMTKIRKGDFILHSSDRNILAISIAKTDCFDADQPAALCAAPTAIDWNIEGYRVDLDYKDLDVPLSLKDYRQWLSDHSEPDSAFTSEGKGKLRYMCPLAEVHARFLIKEIIKLQSGDDLIDCLKIALDEINNKYIEYDQDQLETINYLVGENTGIAPPAWKGKKEAQVLTTSPSTGRVIPKRDPKRAADALARADFKCESDRRDRTFLRKNGIPYTESHHLIPLSCYRDFAYNLDVGENIVSLCSYCHNLLHYGRFEDKKPILEKLYNARIAALCNCGLDITLEKLEEYYK